MTKHAFTRYESVLLFSSDFNPIQLKFLAFYYAKTLRNWGATKIHVRYRGKRSLAYPIKNNKIGDYIEVRFNLVSANLENYIALLKLDTNILRHFIRRKITKKK